MPVGKNDYEDRKAMLGEINDDFYCVTGFKRIPIGEKCYGAENKVCGSTGCTACHRKHPTPEQYKEEYGEEVPDDMPVWVSWKEGDIDHNWQLMYFETTKHLDTSRYVVVACTPFDKPDKDWRPE